MRNCCECNVKLTDNNRSKHQPKIRCLQCFATFSGRVIDVLSGKATTTKEAPETVDGMRKLIGGVK